MTIGVSLAGGGHRASLFGLGVLLYLAHAKREDNSTVNRDVTLISSVSGGSLANAFIAQSMDYRTATTKDVNWIASELASQIAQRGSLFATYLTWVYLIGLAVLAVVPIVYLIFFLPPSYGDWIRIVGVLVIVLVIGVALQARSLVCELAFKRTLFKNVKGRSPRLIDMEHTVKHVLCATEVQTGQRMYFTSKGIFCDGFRPMQKAEEVTLARAAQASAALPPFFPPRRIRATLTSRLEVVWPSNQRKPSRMVVVDGGVLDNLGIEGVLDWVEFRTARDHRELKLPAFDQIIVVSSAANRINKFPLRGDLPFIGELSALKKLYDMPYNTREANSRRALEWRFQALGELNTRGGQGGTIIHIEESPTDLASEIILFRKDWIWQSTDPSERSWEDHPYGNVVDLEARAGIRPQSSRWVASHLFWTDPPAIERAQNVLQTLARTENCGDIDEVQKLWKRWARQNASITTNLSALGTKDAARLMRHGFALAMARLHIVLNYPLTDVPSLSFFEELAERKNRRYFFWQKKSHLSGRSH